MISADAADVKADVKQQEIKKTGSYILQQFL